MTPAATASTTVPMRSSRQAVATHGNGFRLIPPCPGPGICHRLPPVANRCPFGVRRVSGGDQPRRGEVASRHRRDSGGHARTGPTRQRPGLNGVFVGDHLKPAVPYPKKSLANAEPHPGVHGAGVAEQPSDGLNRRPLLTFQPRRRKPGKEIAPSLSFMCNRRSAASAEILSLQ